MKTKIFRCLALFVLLFGLATPATQAQASQKGTAQSQTLSPTSLLNPDGTLNLTKGLSGALDLQGWQVNLDLKRGPILGAGSAWGPLGNGTNGNIYTIVVNNGFVYIGGSFSAICGNAACNSGNTTTYNLAVWNGVSWGGLGGYGVAGGIYAIAVSGNNVYIGGIFTTICADSLCNTGTSARNIAYWNGSAWSGVGNGVDSFVFAIAVNGNTVYAGGNFNYACGNAACNSGNLTVDYIAKWDGISWSAVGHGVTNAVYALAINGGDVYVGGNFTQFCGNTTCNLGNLPANYIAKWSSATSTWFALGNGLSSGVRAVALGAGSNVYIGGFFTQACGNLTCNSGNLVANHVAGWNGSAWFALGNGVDDYVRAMTANGSNLYVGGDLLQICGNASCNSGNTAANRIASWNGSAWSMPGNGVNSYVYAVAANGNAIYTGGAFTQTCGNAACDTGNIVANYIAKFSLPVTTTVASNGAQDGWILESSETSNKGGTFNSTATTFNLGDNAARKQYLGILSFNTGASLPDTAVITAVTLKLKKSAIVGGGNPVIAFKGFVVDIKTGFFGASALQAADFQTLASHTYGPFSPALVGGFYSINLTSGQAYINKLATNSGLTQIRLRFALDDNNNAVANYLSLFSGEGPAADRPQLAITYYLP